MMFTQWILLSSVSYFIGVLCHIVPRARKDIGPVVSSGHRYYLVIKCGVVGCVVRIAYRTSAARDPCLE